MTDAAGLQNSNLAMHQPAYMASLGKLLRGNATWRASKATSVNSGITGAGGRNGVASDGR